MNDKCYDILEKYKLSESEYMDNLIFLLDEKDKVICNAVVAWKNIKVTLVDETNTKEQDDWEYLWEHCRYDLKQFMDLTSLDRGDAIGIINKLKGLKLIYPDGSINTNANKLVRSITKKRLEKQTGQKISGD